MLLVESHSLTAVFRHEEAAMLQLGMDYSIVFTLVHERRVSGRQAILEVSFIVLNFFTEFIYRFVAWNIYSRQLSATWS